MISVKSQRSDEDSAVILSQHRPTRAGLTAAHRSYTWWVERTSRVYPTTDCCMDIRLEYRGLVLDPDIVRKAIDMDLGHWTHIRHILDRLTIAGAVPEPA